ncbi:MAG: hypothetical protein QXP88_00325 [Thermoproteota archaeon]
MPICYIEQTEIYNSSSQNDRLTILNAPSSTSLLEDLNYIRSVIFNIIGTDPLNTSNTWYKVPFYNLTVLYNYYSSLLSDFSVEHFTQASNPAKAGQHKDTNVNGYLRVTSYATIAGSLTSGSQTINGNEDVTGYSHVVGNITTDANLSVGYDGTVGRDFLINRNLTVVKNTTLGDFSFGTTSSINTRTTYLNSPDVIHQVLDTTTFSGFSNVFSIPGRHQRFVSDFIKIGGSSYISFLDSSFEHPTYPVLAKTELQAAMDSSQGYVVKNFFMYQNSKNYYSLSINSNSYKKEKIFTSLNTSVFPLPADSYTETPIDSTSTYDGGSLVAAYHSQPSSKPFMLEEKTILSFDYATSTYGNFTLNKTFFYYNPTESLFAFNNYSPTLIDYTPVKRASYANTFYKLGVSLGNTFYNILELVPDEFIVFAQMQVAGPIYSQGSVSLPVITL